MMSHWAERSAEARVAEGVAVMWRLVTERLGLAVTLAEVQHSYGVLKTNAVDVMEGGGQALFPNRSDGLREHSLFPLQ